VVRGSWFVVRGSWFVLCALAVIVVACSEAPSTAPQQAEPSPAAFPRLTATAANINLCDDATPIRDNNKAFVGWQTKRKSVNASANPRGKPAVMFELMKFDAAGMQTGRATCVLAHDSTAVPFAREYFRGGSVQAAAIPSRAATQQLVEGWTCLQMLAALNGNATFCQSELGWSVCTYWGDIPPQTRALPASILQAREGVRCWAGNNSFENPPSPDEPWSMGDIDMGELLYTPVGGGGGGYYTVVPACAAGTERIRGLCRSRAEQISDLVDLDPYALLDVPCGDISKWASLAQMSIPLSVLTRLVMEPVLSTEWPSAMIQTLQGAKGPVVNMDYYAVTVPIANIPNGLSVNGYLEHVRTNSNNDVSPPTHCSYYPGLTGEEQRWTGNNPLGTVFSITLDPIFESGSVVTTAYYSNRWTFSTVRTPEDMTHPVSGNREFGAVDNGNGTATFYTKATDRISTDLNRILDFTPVLNVGILS